MDVVTGSKNFPINFKKHTLQLHAPTKNEVKNHNINNFSIYSDKVVVTSLFLDG